MAENISIWANCGQPIGEDKQDILGRNIMKRKNNGYSCSAEEAAELSRKAAFEMYDKAKETQKEIEELPERIDSLKRRYTDELTKYRHYSVDRVLNYIRVVQLRDSSLSSHDIDTYLCHCQNKLNGNIDGIEIAFSKEHNELSKEHNKLSKEYDRLSKELSKGCFTIEKAINTISTRQEEELRLQNKLRDMVPSSDELQRGISQICQENMRLQENVTKLTDNVRELQERNTKLQEQNKSLSMEIRRLQPKRRDIDEPEL